MTAPLQEITVDNCPVCGKEALLWTRAPYAGPGYEGLMVIACRNYDCGIEFHSRRIEGVWETAGELAARWNQLGTKASGSENGK